MKPPPPSDALCAHYFAGEASPAEARALEQWAASDPANRKRLEAARLIWEAQHPQHNWDLDGLWERISKRVRAPRLAWTIEPTPEPRIRRAALAAAAVVVLVVGTGVALFYRAPHRGGWRTYETARAQRETFQLTDGTRLILAPQSRLQIPDDYGRRSRDLALEGEALVTVVHDSTRPFRIRAGSAIVEDIGTRFDLRAYPEDSSVAVAVAEGTVALGRTAGEGVLVRSGEVGTLAPGGLMRTSPGELAGYIDWAEGRLHFAGTPLPVVLRAIGRWYDLDIRVADPTLNTQTISAEFVLGSPDAMLQALAVAVNAHLARSGPNGRIVTLSR